MEKYKRCAYALASFDDKTQDPNKYREKQYLLEKCCENINTHINTCEKPNKTLAASANYSDEKYITACVYKQKLFVGFQNKISKEISLNDDSNCFVNSPKVSYFKLESRIKNAIDWHIRGDNLNMSERLVSEWDKLTPLLETLIDYENNFEQLPDDKKQFLISSGIKEYFYDMER